MLKAQIEKQAGKAKEAARILANTPSDLKNNALLAMAERIESETGFLISENENDLRAGKEKGLAEPLLDRLTLDGKRVGDMAAGLREVAALPDPVGEILTMNRLPNGLQVGRMRVPIGVIGIVYESRPNVTADTAGLCIKSGNSVILRGGSEAIYSNRAIARILGESCESVGLPPDGVTLIETTDRQAIFELLKLDHFIDLIIPRGGEGLIRTVTEHARMPVMKHDKGVCHTYVDNDAEIPMAEEICFNAKAQRPATCNAMETLLVHEKIAPSLLPGLSKRFQEAGVTLRGCPLTCEILKKEGIEIILADEADWSEEYLDLTLAVRVVDSFEAAVEHIAKYGSEHSEAIITRDYARANRFLSEVDASAVFVNASTRFNDGYQLGLGAEMGISTSRIHARGPMGLEALTCAKFIVLGDGQTR